MKHEKHGICLQREKKIAGERSTGKGVHHMTLEQVCTRYYHFVTWCTSDEDATQTTFVKVCKAWQPEYEAWNETLLRAWLRRIANNTLIDLLRYRSHRNHEELGEECIAPGDVESDVEQRVLIATCLATLTIEQRRILLSTAQGYDYQECLPDTGRSMAFRRIKQAKNAFIQEWHKAA